MKFTRWINLFLFFELSIVWVELIGTVVSERRIIWVELIAMVVFVSLSSSALITSVVARPTLLVGWVTLVSEIWILGEISFIKQYVHINIEIVDLLLSIVRLVFAPKIDNDALNEDWR